MSNDQVKSNFSKWSGSAPPGKQSRHANPKDEQRQEPYFPVKEGRKESIKPYKLKMDTHRHHEHHEKHSKYVPDRDRGKDIIQEELQRDENGQHKTNQSRRNSHRHSPVKEHCNRLGDPYDELVTHRKHKNGAHKLPIHQSAYNALVVENTVSSTDLSEDDFFLKKIRKSQKNRGTPYSNPQDTHKVSDNVSSRLSEQNIRKKLGVWSDTSSSKSSYLKAEKKQLNKLNIQKPTNKDTLKWNINQQLNCRDPLERNLFQQTCRDPLDVNDYGPTPKSSSEFWMGDQLLLQKYGYVELVTSSQEVLRKESQSQDNGEHGNGNVLKVDTSCFKRNIQGSFPPQSSNETIQKSAKDKLNVNQFQQIHLCESASHPSQMNGSNRDPLENLAKQLNTMNRANAPGLMKWMSEGRSTSRNGHSINVDLLQQSLLEVEMLKKEQVAYPGVPLKYSQENIIRSPVHTYTQQSSIQNDIQRLSQHKSFSEHVIYYIPSTQQISKQDQLIPSTVEQNLNQVRTLPFPSQENVNMENGLPCSVHHITNQEYISPYPVQHITNPEYRSPYSYQHINHQEQVSPCSVQHIAARQEHMIPHSVQQITLQNVQQHTSGGEFLAHSIDQERVHTADFVRQTTSQMILTQGNCESQCFEQEVSNIKVQTFTNKTLYQSSIQQVGDEHITIKTSQNCIQTNDNPRFCASNYTQTNQNENVSCHIVQMKSDTEENRHQEEMDIMRQEDVEIILSQKLDEQCTLQKSVVLISTGKPTQVSTNQDNIDKVSVQISDQQTQVDQQQVPEDESTRNNCRDENPETKHVQQQTSDSLLTNTNVSSQTDEMSSDYNKTVMELNSLSRMTGNDQLVNNVADQSELLFKDIILYMKMANATTNHIAKKALKWVFIQEAVGVWRTPIETTVMIPSEEVNDSINETDEIEPSISEDCEHMLFMNTLLFEELKSSYNELHNLTADITESTWDLLKSLDRLKLNPKLRNNGETDLNKRIKDLETSVKDFKQKDDILTLKEDTDILKLKEKEKLYIHNIHVMKEEIENQKQSMIEDTEEGKPWSIVGISTKCKVPPNPKPPPNPKLLLKLSTLNTTTIECCDIPPCNKITNEISLGSSYEASKELGSTRFQFNDNSSQNVSQRSLNIAPKKQISSSNPKANSPITKSKLTASTLSNSDTLKKKKKRSPPRSKSKTETSTSSKQAIPVRKRVEIQSSNVPIVKNDAVKESQSPNNSSPSKPIAETEIISNRFQENNLNNMSVDTRVNDQESCVVCFSRTPQMALSVLEQVGDADDSMNTQMSVPNVNCKESNMYINSHNIPEQSQPLLNDVARMTLSNKLESNDLISSTIIKTDNLSVDEQGSDTERVQQKESFLFCFTRNSQTPQGFLEPQPLSDIPYLSSSMSFALLETPLSCSRSHISNSDGSLYSNTECFAECLPFEHDGMMCEMTRLNMFDVGTRTYEQFGSLQVPGCSIGDNNQNTIMDYVIVLPEYNKVNEDLSNNLLPEFLDL